METFNHLTEKERERERERERVCVCVRERERVEPPLPLTCLVDVNNQASIKNSELGRYPATYFWSPKTHYGVPSPAEYFKTITYFLII